MLCFLSFLSAAHVVLGDTYVSSLHIIVCFTVALPREVLNAAGECALLITNFLGSLLWEELRE
jgi:hypothetical protein